MSAQKENPSPFHFLPPKTPLQNRLTFLACTIFNKKLSHKYRAAEITWTLLDLLSQAWMEWLIKKRKAFDQRGDMAIAAWAEQQQRELNLRVRRLSRSKVLQYA